MLLTLILSLLYGLLPTVCLHADEAGPAFRNLGIREGFTQTNVLSLYQDSSGAIWTAGKNGIARYSGVLPEDTMPVASSDFFSPVDVKAVFGEGDDLVYFLMNSNVVEYDIRTAACRQVFSAGLVGGNMLTAACVENGVVCAASENSLYFRDYAISQAKQGKTEEAEACLEEAVKLGLGEDSIYMVRGEVSFVQNRYEEAAEYLEQAISTSTDGDLRKRAVLLYDDIFRELGDAYLEEEIAFLEQEESRESGSAAGMNLTERLADAYARKAEADGESREEYYRKALDRFLALYENGYTTRQMMENIAIIRQALGEYDQAEEMLFAMAEQYPDSYISYKRLAYLEAERQQEKENQERDYSRMKEYYDRARELYGDQDTDQEMQMLDNLIRDLKDGNWL